MTDIRKNTHKLIDTIPEKDLGNIYDALLKLKALNALSGIAPADVTQKEAKAMRVEAI